MPTGRRIFYKLFYPAFLPMGLIALFLAWILSCLPPIAFAGLVVGIPGVLTSLFWTKLGEMELTQIITTRKDGLS